MIAFNVAVTGYADGASLGCLLRDEAGQLVAGLDGFTWGGYAMIEWLWVHDDHRHDGLGTRLVEAAEDEAVRRGCVVIRVNTHTFQAPGLYVRLAIHRSASPKTPLSVTGSCSSRNDFSVSMLSPETPATAEDPRSSCVRQPRRLIVDRPHSTADARGLPEPLRLRFDARGALVGQPDVAAGRPRSESAA